jgi:lipopolysaccharide export LptBFGC system permease protein LptF
VSLLIFIVYLNLLGLTRSALEDKSIPLWINFWWVHALFAVLTLVLLRKRTRFKARALRSTGS